MSGYPGAANWLLPDGVNHWNGRKGSKLAVVHIMDGTMEGTRSCFNNPRWEASSNYAISLIGYIAQYVSDEDSAWANGIWETHWDSNNPVLAGLRKGGLNPNEFCYSIELEGHPGQIFPEPQINALIDLLTYICKTYSIPADRTHIIGHYQISGDSRARCPGPTFPWDRVVSEVSKRVNGGGTVVPVSNGNNFQDPVTGYWVIDNFADFYRNNGGLAIFGRPISGMKAGDPDFENLTIQWFERARFEKMNNGNVQLGLVGTEALAAYRKNLSMDQH